MLRACARGYPAMWATTARAARATTQGATWVRKRATCVCVCVCVRERERDRKRAFAGLLLDLFGYISLGIYSPHGTSLTSKLGNTYQTWIFFSI